MKETLDFFNQPEPPDNISNLTDQEPEDIEAGQVNEKNNVQKQLEKVKDFSRLYLENIYQNGINIHDRHKQLMSDESLSHQIANLTGHGEEFKNNFLPKEYRQCMAVFIQELIKFSSEKLGIQDQKEKAYIFISSIKDLLFSYSPSIANEIDLDELLLATAKANRVPEIQGWFGQTMVGETVYEINFSSEERINSLIQKIKNLSVPDTLDIIQQLETIGAKAAGEGWADRAVTKTEKIIQGIKDQHYSPLTAYAVDSALERVKEEHTEPTLGIVTFNGNRGQGRISETLQRELKRESLNFQLKIKPSVKIPLDGEMVQIAADSIAITDHTNTPAFFAQVDVHNLPKGEVQFNSYESIQENNELNPFAKTPQEQTPLLLRHLHDPKMRQAIEGDLNINLLSLPLRSQIHLLRFLSNTNQKTFNRFKTIITTNPSFKENFLRSFLVVSEDQAYGEHLLTLAETIPNQESGEKLFAAYTSFSDQVHSVAKIISKDLQEMYQDLEITEETIVQGLLVRGKDYLVELKDALQKNPHQAEQLINSFISELQAENPKTQIIRSQFKNIASLLSKENIELDKYEKSQALILESLLDKDNKAMSFRVLQRMNRLQPIPEIHWKVDRSIEDYNRRLGIQLPLFLKERSNSKNSKQTLLEIGPGNGLNKEERDKQGITKYYNDFALSDKIYYPLDSVISKVLNFETIEKEIGQTLSLEEKNQLSGIIYKSLIISEGRAHEDTLSYDTAIQNKLDQDINSLKEILPTLGSKIKKATLLPSEISSRSQSGEVIYPHKIDVTTLSSTIQLAKKILEKNITHYLNNDWETADYNTYISGFPANTMIGDIKDINRLADNQIDVELAVRSTVYSRHEDYENFLTTLVDKLKTGGVALDDSIRDNDGWYYRFAEIIKAREQFNNETEILVILGPGFPSEDYQQERVPLSLIITKEGSSKELIASQLEPNCEVISFDKLTYDEKYLTSLDSTGLTYTRAQAAKKTTSTLAA